MDGTKNIINVSGIQKKQGRFKFTEEAGEGVREAADHDPDVKLCEGLECNGYGYLGF